MTDAIDVPVIVRCALPIPLAGTLDYLLPEKTVGPTSLRPGIRVRAPLGKRILTGICTGIHSNSNITLEHLKPLDAILDEEPLLDTHQLALLTWTANYYLHPIGETLALGFAPRERRGEPPAPTGKPGITLNQRGRGLPPGALKHAKKQAALLERLQQRPHSFEELQSMGLSRAIARELLAKNLVDRVDTNISQPWRVHHHLEPNDEQANAIDAINASAKQFTCHLLDGVTGSGKTEVYLQCIADTIMRGQQVLVLLPEIGLTPQMVGRFAARFDAPIALLHSKLSDSERDRHWARARSGKAAIVLGTRSAVFAPLADLGLIIADEEHDASFQQQNGLRYSARDVAVKRAQLVGCPIVLGSATPSLESFANAQRRRYQWHRLTQRAGGASTPEKHVVDIRGLTLNGGLSPAMQQEVKSTLKREEQALLFLNRRGFAPTLLCQDCGWVANCDHCDARMTLHRRPAALCCHHCNAKKSLPLYCLFCGARRLVSTGIGTEQTEDTLRIMFPNTTVFRVDSDTMSRRHAMADFHRKIEAAGPCIIVGTQMLTKGHHFPKVTCVGVIDADSLLLNPDFRGEERLLQLLTQVGGRAGRAEAPGRVFIQTYNPQHPLIVKALNEPYCDTAATLLTDRLRRQLPPFGALAMIRCDSRALEDGIDFLMQVADALRLTVPQSRNIALIGPIPAAMTRRAGLYRCQLLLHAASRKQLAIVTAFAVSVARAQKLPAGLRWFMDVDPPDTA